jgi:hypothetical protein
MLEPAAAVPWRVLVRVRVRVHARVVCAVQGFGGVDGGGGGVAAPSPGPAPECSICLEEQGCGEECTHLPCGHEYHRQVWSTPCPCVKPPPPHPLLFSNAPQALIHTRAATRASSPSPDAGTRQPCPFSPLHTLVPRRVCLSCSFPVTHGACVTLPHPFTLPPPL